jgi:hypothetical protein
LENFARSDRKRPFLGSFAIGLLCLGVFSSAYAVVCRAPGGIAGFGAWSERAEAVLPAKTTDPHKAAVYIARTRQGLYFHSNFVTEGFDVATKIGKEDITDLKTAFYNILASDPDAPVLRNADGILREHLNVILDESTFDKLGHPTVDLGDAKQVQMRSSSAPVERLGRVRGLPLLMSKISGCCLFGIPPHRAAEYSTLLDRKPFERKDVRVVSLVRDSGTDAEINRSATLRGLMVGNRSQGAQSIADLENTFKQSRGKTVVLVSHVEGERFVRRDAANKIVMALEISEVRKLAKLYDVQLVDLGCETARIPKELGLGVVNKFNTVAAIRALENAVSQSKSYSEFFDRLAGEDLRIVIDEGFVRGWALCADVYGRARANLWVKLARIFVSFREETTR